jgi:ring-1,2-phenylacetyl-CoA epoxidase subunit PaaD
VVTAPQTENPEGPKAPARVDEAYARLAEVPDPEIPVLSILDLGVIRFVQPEGEGLRVGISPTYSGCPATDVIARDVRQALESAGLGPVELETVLAPPWSTEDISDEGREKLKAYGIAPPARLKDSAVPPQCPQCGSSNTEVVSAFGSTPCKALRRCLACLEPFEHFKCL